MTQGRSTGRLTVGRAGVAGLIVVAAACSPSSDREVAPPASTAAVITAAGASTTPTATTGNEGDRPGGSATDDSATAGASEAGVPGDDAGPTGSVPGTSATVGPADAAGRPGDGVLVFHRTTGFRHGSIPAGISAITELVATEHAATEVVATDDPAVFTDEGLAPYRVIVFLSTTGDVLDQQQEEAMERFVRSGGGFVGIHAAADTEYDWDWYGGLVGAYFLQHPAPQPGRVVVAPVEHPITVGLPNEFTVHEEWYDFRAPPPASVTVLASLDEASYAGGSMGTDHPIVWAHEYDGGRSVYLGFGHDAAAFDDPLIRTMIGQAIAWTRGSPSP